MNDAERIWQQKSDDDLLEAAAELEQFTPQGREIIRAEMKRRGLEDPVEQASARGGDGNQEEPPEQERVGEPGAGVEVGDDADEEGRVAAIAPECLRCEVALEYRGTRKFHEGTHWGALGEIGHLFEKSESFDVYVCPSCGHVDLFVDGLGEDARPE
jgi:hypothetical protein